MKRIPINTDGECAKTILAGYYKYGVATLLGGNFGTTGTVILEWNEESYTIEHGQGCLQVHFHKNREMRLGKLPWQIGTRRLGYPDDEHNGSV